MKWNDEISAFSYNYFTFLYVYKNKWDTTSRLVSGDTGRYDDDWLIDWFLVSPTWLNNFSETLKFVKCVKRIWVEHKLKTKSWNVDY